MKFTDPQGRTLEVNSPDGSIPSEGELDQMFSMKYGNVSQSTTPPDRFQIKSSKPYDSYSYMDAAKDTGKTIINSVADLGKNISQPILHPLQAAGSLASAAIHPIDTAGNIGDYIGNRYGSMDKLANTVSTDPFGFGSDVIGTVGLAKGASVLGKGAANNTSKFLNFDQKSLDLAKKVRAVASQAKQAEVNKFGVSQKMIQDAKPGTSISLRNVVDNINTNMPEMAQDAKNALRKTPGLGEMIDNPQLADNVSLTDSQSIINHLNTKVPRNIKYNHLDIMDALSDIKAAQLDAFPEMAAVKEAYGKFAEDYKLIRSSLNPKSTPNAILTNFNNNIAIKDAASRVLAPVMKDMGRLRTQVGVTNFIKRLISLGVAGKVGKGIIPH